MPHVSKNLHNWEFISASVTILFTSRGHCSPYTLSWTACLANKQLSIFSRTETRWHISAGAADLYVSGCFTVLEVQCVLKAYIWLITYNKTYFHCWCLCVSPCWLSSHWFALHSLCPCSFPGNPHTGTPPADDTAKLVLHLGWAGAPLYVALHSISNPHTEKMVQFTKLSTHGGHL